ncbi:MAG TPA: bifunctional 2-C-methyl-D-erythritol 4-phosphate cytidylyltransferase/2-C-methyl-D-erythritol 2,4-cyclodiphosphate synthase [Aestuariivirgaceae bacterium]|jgi:2-C-methyl-D-erythritol 4-phosphate cytidylyltransferase/2-C-methyl-D-erythritol 2,4-cyclodiphosphate synthase
MSTAVLVLAAGSGLRAGGDLPKQYQLLGGQAVLRHALRVFSAHPMVAEVRTVISPADATHYQAAATGLTLGSPIAGGATRQESGRRGLEALAEANPRLVLIHDAARPFVSSSLITSVIRALDRHEGAVPAVPVTETLKRAIQGVIKETIDRSGMWAAQTPQGFRYELIRSAHERAATSGLSAFTDDAAIGEWAGMEIAVVPGEAQNLKLTTAEDMRLAEERFVRDNFARCPDIRVGQGFDVHAFEPGDKVVLCGIHIPHPMKLKGHSDADAPMHALTDALLGSIGEVDIGTYFPPTDPQWKDAESAIFLRHAAGLIEKRGGFIAHVDLTIVCEAPKIAPHIGAMKKSLAALLGVPSGRIAIKATTSEGLGFIGRGEGLAAFATATVRLP